MCILVCDSLRHEQNAALNSSLTVGMLRGRKSFQGWTLPMFSAPDDEASSSSTFVVKLLHPQLKFLSLFPVIHLHSATVTTVTLL